MYGSILLLTDEGKGEFANQSFCDPLNLKCSPKELVGLTARKSSGGSTRLRASSEKKRSAVSGRFVALGQPVKGEEVAMAGGRTCLLTSFP